MDQAPVREDGSRRMTSTPQGGPSVAHRSDARPAWRSRWREGLSTLVFLLPLLVIFGVFSWLPIIRAVVMSIQDTNLVSDPTFVGIENYRRVLADPLFWTAIRNTLWFAFLALV